MMRLNLSSNVIAVFFVGFAAMSDSIASEAYSASPSHLDKIHSMQLQSISQGVNLGKLTPREVEKISVQRQEIKRLEESMNQDGVLSSNELSVLFTKLEEARENINRLSKNSISIAAKI